MTPIRPALPHPSASLIVVVLAVLHGLVLGLPLLFGHALPFSQFAVLLLADVLLFALATVPAKDLARVLHAIAECFRVLWPWSKKS